MHTTSCAIAVLLLGAAQLATASKMKLDWHTDFEPDYEVWQPSSSEVAQVTHQTFAASHSGLGGLEIDVTGPTQSWHVQFRVRVPNTAGGHDPPPRNHASMCTHICARCTLHTHAIRFAYCSSPFAALAVHYENVYVWAT